MLRDDLRPAVGRGGFLCGSDGRGEPWPPVAGVRREVFIDVLADDLPVVLGAHLAAVLQLFGDRQMAVLRALGGVDDGWLGHRPGSVSARRSSSRSISSSAAYPKITRRSWV